MMLFHKPTEPQLNIDDASSILENVFTASEVEPNTIPLEVLTSYSNYRKERFSLQRTVLVVCMVLFLTLPFLFVAPSFVILSETHGFDASPVYRVDVDTFVPVQRVTAMIDGHNVPVYEADSHVYSIEPSRNGQMAVSVTLMNHQTVTNFIQVNNVDAEVPVIVSNSIDENYVYLYLSDAGSGINYEEIKAISLSGQTITPASYDTSSGCVAFDYPKESLNIYIPDNADNTLQLVLTLK